MDNKENIKEAIQIFNEIKNGEENFERIAQKFKIPLERLMAIIDVNTAIEQGWKIEEGSLDDVVRAEDSYKFDVFDYGEFSEVIKYDKEQGLIYTEDGEYTLHEFMKMKGIQPYRKEGEVNSIETAKSDYIKTIQTYIRDLSPEQQEIYSLSLGFVDGTPKTTAEIARELGIPEEEAKIKINETFEKFKE